MSNQAGQPLNIEALLPLGITLDDVLLVTAMGTVFLLVYSIGQLFIDRDRMAPRLKAIAERRAELKSGLIGPTRRKKVKSQSGMEFIRNVVSQLKLTQQHQMGELQKRMTRAGFRSKDAVIIYAFAKLVAPFAALALGLILAKIDWAAPFEAKKAWKWLIVLGVAYFGSSLPDIIIRNKRDKRYHAIQKGLPDALDLMMICAEAGLSLAAALDRVSKELGRTYPEIAEELSLTSVELGFLPDRQVALKNLADRVDLQEIRGFVNVIVQTDKYGTPISQALRVLSKEFRTERMLRAEQKAARLPAMMTVPMIVFILPTLFVIVMAPAIISVLDTTSK
ncbi:MAG: type II secretion system F family protein [Alphaproteobacteria bacterium]|nr:type II secretion system F family protein [Alphaproteobacteria bacterium]